MQTLQQITRNNGRLSTDIDDAFPVKKPASVKADNPINESKSMSPIRKYNRCSNNSSVTPETGLSGNTQPGQTTTEGLNKSQLENNMTSSEGLKSDQIFENSSSSQQGFNTALLLLIDD